MDPYAIIDCASEGGENKNIGLPMWTDNDVLANISHLLVEVWISSTC